MPHKAQNENQKSSQDQKNMKGNLGQQDAMRDKQSESDLGHMGERSKEKREEN